jgi:hypothetical protein
VDAPVELPTGGSSVEVEPEAVPATSQLLHSKSSEGGRFCVVGCRSLSPPFSRLRVNRLTDGHFVRQAGLRADLRQGRGGKVRGNVLSLFSTAGAKRLGQRRPTSIIFGRAFHVAEAVADICQRHAFFRHSTDSATTVSLWGTRSNELGSRTARPAGRVRPGDLAPPEPGYAQARGEACRLRRVSI